MTARDRKLSSQDMSSCDRQSVLVGCLTGDTQSIVTEDG